MDRPNNTFSHEWHVAINKHSTGCHDRKEEFPHWMYEGKKMADEVPRMASMFERERTGKLAVIHRQCSHAEAEVVTDNHLTCCLGVRCSECPFLLALNTAELTPEQIDQAKAWTCAAHIVSKGGDMANEGYLLTVDDQMFWNKLHSSLASAHNQL